MARIKPLETSELGELEEQFAAFGEQLGYLPNSLLTMARVPGLVPALAGFTATVFDAGLIPTELVRMVAFVSSAASGCRYCQAHTASLAEVAGVSRQKVDALWEFQTSDLFSDAERAALQLAFHGGQSPNGATDEDFEACRVHFSEEQIAAIVATIALFGFLNRWNDTVATQLEDKPATFAEDVLQPGGWERGKHA